MINDMIQKLAEKAGKTRSAYIEQLAAAFMMLTNLPADQCEIVEQVDGNRMTWHIRQRDDARYLTLFKQFDEEVGKTQKLQAENAELRTKLAMMEMPMHIWHYKAGDETELEAVRKSAAGISDCVNIKCEPHVLTFAEIIGSKWRAGLTNAAKVDIDVNSDIGESPMIGVDLSNQTSCTCKSLLAGHEPGCPHAS